jgi:hypothetical protein
MKTVTMLEFRQNAEGIDGLIYGPGLMSSWTAPVFSRWGNRAINTTPRPFGFRNNCRQAAPLPNIEQFSQNEPISGLRRFAA